ncbi:MULTISPECIES: tellurite resistance TerB family protein [Chelativorans]|jgi:tellurite resistance protein|uniref:Co-chaperone DjlA N-terminal domain-containing protein n=1 Tax=Chelativorans sp. (strain BNC1) TaxID=266779 RepID=Q11MF4_CHESB|nr:MULTISPECIES: tellurite resistance TerB family protein [Chelativorans]
MNEKPSPQEALVYLMVIVSAADRDMTDAELGSIGRLVRTVPVFDGFDQESIIRTAQECQKLLQQEDGPERVLDLVRDTVPAILYDTAYALAVDVVAADLYVEPEEMRMLQIVRRRLKLEPLVAAAIERAARARHRTMEAALRVDQ